MKWAFLIAALVLPGTQAMARCGGAEMCVHYYAAHYHVSRICTPADHVPLAMGTRRSPTSPMKR